MKTTKEMTIKAYLLISLWCIPYCLSIKWLSKEVHEQKKWMLPMCSMKKFLFNSKQKATCEKHIGLMKYVSKAAEITRDECVEQFSDREWNCLSIYLAPKFGDDLSNATKESAVVYAMSSAALVLSTAIDCARGIVTNCGCTGVRNHVLFYDHACDPVLSKAVDFAREFTMPGQKKLLKMIQKSKLRSERMMIQQHNRKVGWKVTETTHMVRCKCRGTTGECPMKICYKALPDFKSVATKLKSRYDNAVRVNFDRKNKAFVRYDNSRKIVSGKELIYSESSVNKCGLTDMYMSNRACSLEDGAENNCKKICCGGKYRKKKIIVLASCNCKFQWCCKVECDKCNLEKDIFVCAETS